MAKNAEKRPGNFLNPVWILSFPRLLGFLFSLLRFRVAIFSLCLANYRPPDYRIFRQLESFTNPSIDRIVLA